MRRSVAGPASGAPASPAEWPAASPAELPAASPAGALAILPLGPDDVDAVMAIEQRAYAFPWSRGNVTDSLAAGHRVVGLWAGSETAHARELLAYSVSMAGVEERHLLNLTVAPAWQRRGLARRLLDDLLMHARERGEAKVWLEVRQSNQAARELYGRYGFRAIGMRRGYYPDGQGRREDAVVLALETAGDQARGPAPGAAAPEGAAPRAVRALADADIDRSGLAGARLQPPQNAV